uniref:E3 ubiquitin-protein ligase TRIM41-like n=1 Tax=Gouania willdenowi TaxID=441366 RepID=A0A8C5GQT2_GOUWI
MSPACSGTSEHHFLCSICLEVLTDPVTTPCGHNFCKTCISTHWDTSTTSRCPVCNQALKSCLDCVISYCETHLEPHLTASGLRRHQLVEPVENLESMMCPKGKAEGVEVFTALMELVRRGLKELMKTMEEQQEAEEREAEGLIKELEEEIFELMKRSSEVEQLSHSEDHLLQDFCSLKAPPATKDWTEVMVHPSSHEGTVLRAVAQLEDTLSDEMMKIKMLEMKRLQQFAVDVTLDSLTAHPYLVLSDDEKLVYFSNVKKNLPHNKERFSYCACVLGKQNFSSGRFYFEVQVKGKTKWYLGVAKESINRKGKITLTPKNGYWTVALRDGNVVGVYVDCPDGRLSFYKVSSDSMTLIHTVCTSFTDTLYPGFGFWFGSSVSLSPL